MYLFRDICSLQNAFGAEINIFVLECAKLYNESKNSPTLSTCSIVSGTRI